MRHLDDKTQGKHDMANFFEKFSVVEEVSEYCNNSRDSNENEE
jgi:hypothetical protein